MSLGKASSLWVVEDVFAVVGRILAIMSVRCIGQADCRDQNHRWPVKRTLITLQVQCDHWLKVSFTVVANTVEAFAVC